MNVERPPVNKKPFKTKDYFKLVDVLDNEFYFTKEELDKFFSLPYCITCASAQGLTINKPLCICIDHYFCDVRYIYTAFTRATNYKDVVFYLNIDSPYYIQSHTDYRLLVYYTLLYTI